MYLLIRLSSVLVGGAFIKISIYMCVWLRVKYYNYYILLLMCTYIHTYEAVCLYVQSCGQSCDRPDSLFNPGNRPFVSISREGFDL